MEFSPFSRIRAANRGGTTATQQSIHVANRRTTITIREAERLLQSLPPAKELRVKGINVKWDVQAVPDMNNEDYYFFWIYNPTAQKNDDTGAISVGDFAVNKHTADVRDWTVSQSVFYGDDGVLVSSDELERAQEDLRQKYGIDSDVIRRFRSAHLAKRIVPRALGQSATRLAVTERSGDTAELSCWSRSGQFGSRVGVSPTFSSGSGDRAYVAVDAEAFRPRYRQTYTGPLCQNTVRLFLAKDGASSFGVAFDSSRSPNDCMMVEGTNWCAVKGAQIVDWSKDGNFLLVNLALWEYESDAQEMKVPIVYNAKNGALSRPDVYRLFGEYYTREATKNCEFDLSAQGFSPDGNLIISASRPPVSPYYDQVFCFQKNQTLLFDLRTNEITRLPSDYKIEHYGILKVGAVAKPSF